jgi:hypothetical protein
MLAETLIEIVHPCNYSFSYEQRLPICVVNRLYYFISSNRDAFPVAFGPQREEPGVGRGPNLGRWATLWVNEQRADGSYFGLGLQAFCQGQDGGRLNDDPRTEEQDAFPLGGAHANVARFGAPKVPGQT